MKLLTLRILFNHFKYLFVASVIFVSSISLMSCDGSGGLGAVAVTVAVGAGLGGGPGSAGVVVAAGGEVTKPALLLPFTAEVAALAISPDGKTLYASDRFHNTVSVIDISEAGRRAVAVLDAGTGPRSLAITPKDGKLLLIPNFGTGTQNFNPLSPGSIFDDGKPGKTVRLIETETFKTVEDVEVGRRPVAIAVKSDDSKAYVANMESENVSVIDLATFAVDSVTLSGDTDGTSSREIIPVAIAITNDGSKVLVVSILADPKGRNAIVDIIDTESDQRIASIEVGPSGGPPFNGIAIHPDDTKAYVTNPDDNSFSIINLNDIDNLPAEADKVTFSSGAAVVPGSLVFSNDGARAYVAFPPANNTLCPATSRGQLAIINTENDTVLQDDIEVGEAAIGLVITNITDDRSKVYTISGCEDPITLKGKVTRVDTSDDVVLAGDIKTIDIFRNRATAVTIDREGREVYVALPDAVAVIDTETDTVVNDGIPVRGSGPTKFSIDDVNGDTKLFAVHPGIDAVSVTELDGSGGTFLGTVPVGSRPASLVIEADQVIVANAGYSRTPDNRISFFEKDIVLPASVTDVDEVVLPPETDDLNLDDFGIGRGPVELKVVGTSDKRLITANFGDFFPNTRRLGDSISRIQDLTDSRQADRIDLFNGSWPIEITPPFENGGNQFVYILDLQLNNEGQIFPFEIGNSDTEPPIFTVNLPVSSEILVNELYALNYIPENEQIIINKFDLANTPDNPNELNTIVIDFPSASIVTNAGKLKILKSKRIAFVLHGGDRSFSCDGDVFCEIGNIVSVINLDDPDSKAFITVGQRPTDITFSEDGTKAFVTNYFDGTVSIIDTDMIVFDNTKKDADKTLSVGKGPAGVFVRDSKVYVANSISNSISVIPIEAAVDDITEESIRTIPLN